MTDQLVQEPPELADELGPVDWIVVEFPGAEFKGEIAGAVADLVDPGPAMLLSADDVAAVAEAAAPGSVAGLLVWENLWAPFGSALAARRRPVGGRGRIPVQALPAALEEDDAFAADEED